MTSGKMIVRAPGSIISRKAACVEISTHLLYSGLPVPSKIPGISLNWRRTSLTISMAAFPTEFIANAEKTTGIIAPTNKAARTLALNILMPSIPVNSTKAANKAKAVNAADAMANPFPIAAVVFPTESRMSVRSRTSSGNSLISAIPPALSAMGPKASMANCIAVVAIMAHAAMATP